MSGHSKWHNIRETKQKMDSVRGKIFGKVTRQIIIAVREGGPDPDVNSKLRLALEKAKEVNMPADNIKRAIQRGTGEISGSAYEEVIYEGYGPGGVAVMVEATTDNRNRTTAELRHVFQRNGGNLGESGCVSWIFSRKGYILLSPEEKEEKVYDIALEAEAEDVKTTEEGYEVITTVENFENAKETFTKAGVKIINAEVTYLPNNTVRLESDEARQLLRLLDQLEDLEDVQKVYANFDIPDEILVNA
jgi:YebC/PmpR family DNA-binding regulatory protein